MEPSGYHGTHELDLVGSLTITEFLKGFGHESAELGAFHDAVVIEVHRAVHPSTTRPAEPNEAALGQYNFITDDAFDAHVAANEFLETDVRGEFKYGTLKPTAVQLGYNRTRGSIVAAPDSHPEFTRVDRTQSGRALESIHLMGEAQLSTAGLAHNGLDVEQQAKLYDQVVPITTRARKEGELAGLSYEFVTEAQFHAAVDAGKLAEWGQADDVLYGTPFPSVGKKVTKTATDVTIGDVIDAGLCSTSVFPPKCPQVKLKLLPLSGLDQVISGCPEYDETRRTLALAIQTMTVPLTTRPRRPNETPGVDYHFVNEAHFKLLEEEGLLFEWGEHNGSCYGTPIPTIAEFKAGRAKAVQPAEASAAQVCEMCSIDLAPEHDNFSFSQLMAVLPRESEVFFRLQQCIHSSTIPVTTRQIKPWEVNGDEYEFVDQKTFMGMVAAGNLFEFGGEPGAFYGTKKLSPQFAPEDAVSRMDRIAARLAPDVEVTVGDIVGVASKYYSAREADMGLTQFFRGQTPQNMDSFRGEVFDVLSVTAMSVAKAPLQITRAVPELSGMYAVNDNEFESLDEQDRFCIRNTASVRLQVGPSQFQDVNVDYGIFKLNKIADAELLTTTQAEFARRQSHQDQVEALTDNAEVMRQKVEAVKEELHTRNNGFNYNDLSSLLSRLEAIVNVEVDMTHIVPAPAAAAAGAAVGPAVVMDDAKVAELQAELVEAKKVNRAYSAYVAQLEAGSGAATQIVVTAEDINNRANGKHVTMAAGVSPVQARMRAKAAGGGSPARVSPASKKWNSLLAGVGDDSAAELSPLKKKLQERRKAKAKGGKPPPPVMKAP
jgi:guanylate kinase